MNTFTLETTVSHLRAAIRSGLQVSRYQVLPVLHMVHIKDGTLNATDCDIFTSVKIKNTQATSEALVPFHELRALAYNLPTDTRIKLSMSNDKLVLIHNSGEYRLPTMPVTDFPTFNFVATTTIDGIPEQFVKALRFVANSASREETRYYLNGVHLSNDATGKTVAVATDGHLLSYYPVGIDLGSLEGVIIPNDAIAIITQKSALEAIETSDNNRIAFHYKDLSVYAKLIDGDYPDWKRITQILNEEERQHITVPRAQFRAALRRLSALKHCQHCPGSIYLAAHKGKLHLISYDLNGCEHRETITLSDPTAFIDTVMCYNRHLLKNAIDTVHSENITLSVKDNTRPTRFTGSKVRQVTLAPNLADKDTVKSLLTRIQKEQV